MCHIELLRYLITEDKALKYNNSVLLAFSNFNMPCFVLSQYILCYVLLLSLRRLFCSEKQKDSSSVWEWKWGEL